jgi:menaquinone-9 beta-reductase
VALLGSGTDVFVIGAGPAGLAAAIAARRKGLTVTVADGAEPLIDKPCGEGLMPGTQTALAELGVEVGCAHGHRFKGVSFLEDGTQVTADFPDGQGIGIRRTLLHELLINESEKCGVNLLWKTAVMGIDQKGVRLNRGAVKASWIIGADGAHSRVRQWANLDDTLLYTRRFACRRHFRMRPWTEYLQIYWGSATQAYVTPVSDEEVCIVTMGESPRAADFDRVLETLPQLEERLVGVRRTSRERGAVTAMHKLVRVWRGNVALVGDASGGVDAVTGEGLRLAFRQANALAESLAARDLNAYGQFHPRLLRRPLQMGAIMLLLGRHNRLRSRMFRILGYRPELFARLLAAHVGHTPIREAVSAGARLGWRFPVGGGSVRG